MMDSKASYSIRICTCVKSVVHRNLKPFAESTRVVRGRGAADLHPLLQSVMETFRIMQNLSELRK